MFDSLPVLDAELIPDAPAIPPLPLDHPPPLPDLVDNATLGHVGLDGAATKQTIRPDGGITNEQMAVVSVKLLTNDHAIACALQERREGAQARVRDEMGQWSASSPEVAAVRRLEASLSECKAGLETARRSAEKAEQEYEAAIYQGEDTTPSQRAISAAKGNVSGHKSRLEILTHLIPQAKEKATTAAAVHLEQILERMHQEARAAIAQHQEPLLAAVRELIPPVLLHDVDLSVAASYIDRKPEMKRNHAAHLAGVQ